MSKIRKKVSLLFEIESKFLIFLLVLFLFFSSFILSSSMLFFSSSVGWMSVLFLILIFIVILNTIVGGFRVGFLSTLLVFVLILVVTISAATGPVYIKPVDVLKVLLDSLPSFSFEVPENYETIVRSIRMPRIAVAALVGFSLALAGTVMQGFFRNPMADPSIIGVSSGAAVGAVASIAISFFPLGISNAAFVGGLLASFGVYIISTRKGKTPVATLLLSGVAVNTFLGAVVSFLLLRSGESLREAVYWLMGNLLYKSWSDLKILLPISLLCFIILMIYSRDLNILLLGEEEARNLGIEVRQTKLILLVVSSFVTAAAVSVSGVIGFVGLVVPHMARLVVGPDHRILLPVSSLSGASFLVVTDTIARTVLGTVEIPVGIITAFVGAPFFLYLLRKKKVHEL